MATSAPYIGSKLSLISNSDIRYEGILYTINTQESTIALKSVRCCGTEGRRAPEIPPSSEIYDFIIFRGQDIKDLTVLESASPALSAQLNDPAIMSVNQRPAGGEKGRGSAPAAGGDKGGKGKSSGYEYGSSGYGGSYGDYGRGAAGYGGAAAKGASGGYGKGSAKGGGQGYSSWGGSGASSWGGWGSGWEKPESSYRSGGYGKDAGKGYGKDAGKSKDGSKGKGEKGTKGKAEKGGKTEKGKAKAEGKGKGEKASGEGRRGGGSDGAAGGGAPVGELIPSVNEAVKSEYAEDFDYSGTNEKFNKVGKDDDEGIDDKLKPLSGYSKTKSFFDNISCEATERAGDAERPKVDRNKARQSDRETFGDTRRPPRPAGGRRGGKGGARRGARN